MSFKGIAALSPYTNAPLSGKLTLGAYGTKNNVRWRATEHYIGSRGRYENPVGFDTFLPKPSKLERLGDKARAPVPEPIITVTSYLFTDT